MSEIISSLKKQPSQKVTTQPTYTILPPKDTLFDLSKIRCQLIFFNKGQNFNLFQKIKQQLITTLSSISFPIQGVPKKLYLSFFEGKPTLCSLAKLSEPKQDKDKEEKTTNELNNKEYEVNIYLYICVDQKEKRDKYLQIYHDETNSSGDLSIVNRSRLLILYEKDENFPEETNKNGIVHIKITNEIFFAEISKTVLELLTEYCKYINDKMPIAPGLKFNEIVKNEIKTRVSEFIQIQKYDIALDIINKAIDSYSSLDEAKWKETKAIVLFLREYHNMDKTFNYNEQIEDLYDSLTNKYKKEKKYDLYIEAIIRFLTYCSYFPGLICTKNKKFYEIFAKLTRAIEKQSPLENFVYYIKLSNFYSKMKMIRKSKLFMCYALNMCFNNEDLIQMIPFMTNEICKLLNVYDISKNIIEKYEDFSVIHKRFTLNRFKPISIYIKNQENELIESFKKKYDKKTKIYIRNNHNEIEKYDFSSLWSNVQENIYKSLIDYHQKRHNLAQEIKFTLGYLQTLFPKIPTQEQNTILRAVIHKSLNLQEKVFFNLSKIPILMRIIPLSSEIKFDTSTNPNKKNSTNKNKVFLYNPWEKSNHANYYWTAGSFQRIKVQFYNPMDTEVLVNKIIILFKGVKPITYPSSVLVNPKSSVFIVSKINPKVEGITDIIGVQYEIVNSVSHQFVDDNGNGLYYNFENISDDSLNLMNNTKEVISLSNIKIYPQIPLLDIKILDNSFKIIGGVIELYEYQYYTFSFSLENTGAYDINELNCYIYAYKKDDYKIALDETKVKTLIKVGSNYTFNYKYLHKSTQKKIEFRLYYVSYDKNKQSEEEDDVLIKPYLYYTKNFETLSLINITHKKILPMVSSSAANDLAKVDPRVKKHFQMFFSSEKNYATFIIENTHESNIKIAIVNTERDNELLKEDICEGYKSKEISCVLDTQVNIEKIIVKWKFTSMDNVEGKIDLVSIFPDCNVSAWSTFSFNINVEKKEDNCVKCTYSIKNISNIDRSKMKLFLYLYQNYGDDNYLYNATIRESILYDGSLSINIDELKVKETYSYDINVYPLTDETIWTTCLLVDKENKNIYMCPISRELSV